MLKKPNIVGRKGGDNGERIETRRKVEHKAFLNGDGGANKERKDKSNPKEEKKTITMNGKRRNVHQPKKSRESKR